MYNPRDIIDLIAANIRKTRNPFGVPNSQINTWWREAGRLHPAARGRAALDRPDVSGHTLY